MESGGHARLGSDTSDEERPMSPFGCKTDARERFGDRFSAELPFRQVYRKKMVPSKIRKSLPKRWTRQLSEELENTHSDSRMAPSLRGPLPARRVEERAPKIVHGTFYQKPRPKTRMVLTGRGRAIMDAWLDYSDICRARISSRLIGRGDLDLGDGWGPPSGSRIEPLNPGGRGACADDARSLGDDSEEL
jgi:hypothetical protein